MNRPGPRTLAFLAVVALSAAVLSKSLPQSGVLPSVSDTILFTIPLNDDSSTIFYCDQQLPIKMVLAGPVLMRNDQFLFYSRKGYALYDRQGRLKEKHSVIRENQRDRKEQLYCAYPFDGSTVMYCSVNSGDRSVSAIYRKRLGNAALAVVEKAEEGLFPDIGASIMFNLVRNVILDELAPRAFLRPQLVGFTNVKGGERWWAFDRFYTFTSPLIHEQDGRYRSFFPGIRSNTATETEIRRKSVDPIGMYRRDGRLFYCGTLASRVGQQTTDWQLVYTCDEAGNIVYIDSIAKQTNMDITLIKDEDRNVIFTVKGTASFVFPPTVAEDGTIYYGIINYPEKTIQVRKRVRTHYVPQPHKPDLVLEVEAEERFAFQPSVLFCNSEGEWGWSVPKVIIRAVGGDRPARDEEMIRDGYLVTTARQEYRDLDKKFFRKQPAFPPEIDKIRDSLSIEPTIICPYSIMITGPGELQRTFDYPAGEVVLSARALGLCREKLVAVRVDLENCAEILMFRPNGDFVDRFIFNRQPHEKRKDIVAISSSAPIVEFDYEGAGRKFLAWYPAF